MSANVANVELYGLRSPKWNILTLCVCVRVIWAILRGNSFEEVRNEERSSETHKDTV